MAKIKGVSVNSPIDYRITTTKNNAHMNAKQYVVCLSVFLSCVCVCVCLFALQFASSCRANCILRIRRIVHVVQQNFTYVRRLS